MFATDLYDHDLAHYPEWGFGHELFEAPHHDVEYEHLDDFYGHEGVDAYPFHHLGFEDLVEEPYHEGEWGYGFHGDFAAPFHHEGLEYEHAYPHHGHDELFHPEFMGLTNLGWGSKLKRWSRKAKKTYNKNKKHIRTAARYTNKAARGIDKFARNGGARAVCGKYSSTCLKGTNYFRRGASQANKYTQKYVKMMN